MENFLKFGQFCSYEVKSGVETTIDLNPDEGTITLVTLASENDKSPVNLFLQPVSFCGCVIRNHEVRFDVGVGWVRSITVYPLQLPSQNGYVMVGGDQITWSPLNSEGYMDITDFQGNKVRYIPEESFETTSQYRAVELITDKEKQDLEDMDSISLESRKLLATMGMMISSLPKNERSAFMDACSLDKNCVVPPIEGLQEKYEEYVAVRKRYADAYLAVYGVAPEPDRDSEEDDEGDDFCPNYDDEEEEEEPPVYH